MFIWGFKIANYRSFGEDEQTLGPFKKINLFVGQNNSGKSNVLKFITRHYNQFLRNADYKPEAYEHHGRDFGNPIRVRIAFPPDHAFITKFKFHDNRRSHSIELALKEAPLCDKNLVYMPTPKGSEAFDKTTAGVLINDISHEINQNSSSSWGTLIRAWMQNQSQNRPPNSRVVLSEFFSTFWELCASRTDVPIHFIPQDRFIDQNNQKPFQSNSVWNGSEIIDQLARLQNPGHDTVSSSELQANRKKFDSVTKFFRSLVENESATIQVPYNRNTILFDLDGRVATLESLGSGLQQVLLLAVATTYYDNSVFCIEEPEMNMHPTLQRKLLKYLETETNNQYFISTHSSSFLDATSNNAIFHITHDRKKTEVSLAGSSASLRNVCDDLGFRASDLVQSNCLIWVEGPSDRIYLKKLISICSNSSLKEGLHYSFALYGGSIRAHYAVENNWENSGEILEKALEDTIGLLAVNRNSIMITDSDLSETGPLLDEQKIRLQTEFGNSSRGFYWVTQGRTIENYIRVDLFTECRKQIHPASQFYTDDNGIFTNLPVAISTSRSTGDKKNRSCDKIAIARLACQDANPFNEDTDVMTQGKKVIEFIERWNGLA